MTIEYRTVPRETEVEFAVCDKCQKAYERPPRTTGDSMLVRWLPERWVSATGDGVQVLLCGWSCLSEYAAAAARGGSS